MEGSGEQAELVSKQSVSQRRGVSEAEELQALGRSSGLESQRKR